MDEQTEDIKFSKRLNVLIVEDNQVDLRITEAMLHDNETAVASVEVARTLEEALHCLTEKEIDVIILDLNLPDSAGTDTLRRLAGQYGHVSVVVNTGAYEEELGIAALEYGAQDFLVKGRYNGYTLIKGLHYAVKRKELELELKETNRRLAEAQDQLIQAEKMKVVGGLASGVAHEVRNPLATIVYGITYLKQQLDIENDDIRTVMESIDEAAHRANVIIKDLLDFANLGKLKETPVQVAELFDKAVELLNHELDKSDIVFVKEYAEDLPLVFLDKNRVSQVCINLILNAAVAMNKTGTLTLKTAKETLRKDHPFWEHLNKENFQEGQEVVVMSVQDEGTGIKEEDLANIFDPFYTTRRARGGTGLGLSVCRNIMDLHQGAIFLANNDTKGASAHLIFSLNEGKAAS